MKITVASCAFKQATDIDVEKVDSVELDSLAKTCISRAIDALKAPTARYSEKDRFHMSRIFSDMKMTHHTIRFLLEKVEPSESVVSLVLARLQLEALYALCLMFEEACYVTRYLQDNWRKIYVAQLFRRVECAGIERYDEYERFSEVWVRALRDDCGITEEQQRTVDLEELGTALPLGMLAVPIEGFPTPGRIIGKIPRGGKRKMLMRLYPEYQHLSSFAHGLAEASLLRGMFDQHSGWPQIVTSGKKEETFHKLVVGPAFSTSYLGIVQSCTELTTLYPNDLELFAGVTAAWDYLTRGHLIGKAVWGLRTKDLLGAVV